MTETHDAEPTYEIVCPHCRRPFTASLLAGSAERYRGFKCPHCRLFVPRDRVHAPEPAGS